jgi:imidazolonepropionase-like amidohydrolase
LVAESLYQVSKSEVFEIKPQKARVAKFHHEAGGLVVGGMDCGGLLYPSPGFALLHEVELLAEAMGSMAALKAVTSVAARYLGNTRTSVPLRQDAM